MSENRDWPTVSDPRLLAVLQAQIDGALQDLHLCTEDGLGHLARIIEFHPEDALTPHVLAALTDLQGIDRAMQRLQNVISSLDDWEKACEPTQSTPAWLQVLAGRYVMPEEREVVSRVLGNV